MRLTEDKVGFTFVQPTLRCVGWVERMRNPCGEWDGLREAKPMRRVGWVEETHAECMRNPSFSEKQIDIRLH
jgi:hypothetical protein